MRSEVKLTPRQEADAIAREPWFWPEPHEPTPLAKAIQMPLADPNWQTRVLNGYVQTNQRFAGRSAPDGEGKPK